MEILLKRSITPSKRPMLDVLEDGEAAVNIEETDPGIYFQSSSDETLIKIGPCYVGGVAPNSSPPPGGYEGNCIGEFWLDTSVPGSEVLKVWTELGWVSIVSANDAIPDSIISQKGDLIVGVSLGMPGTLPVGEDGKVLVADSNAPLGVIWEMPVAGIPDSIIESKGDLIVGQGASNPVRLPVGSDGDTLISDSAQPQGVRWVPAAVPPSIQSKTVESGELASGETELLWLEAGELLSLVSLSVSGTPPEAWIRIYLTEEAALADTRVVPGPPVPSSNSGFLLELETTALDSSVTLIPVPTVYAESGLFVKVTNQALVSQSLTVTLNLWKIIETPCLPPYYGNSIYLNTSCISIFCTPTGELEGSTPGLSYLGGGTIPAEASNSYSGPVSGGSGSSGQFAASRGLDGSVSSLALSLGSGYAEGDSIQILGSLIGGVDGVDDITVLLSLENGMKILGAWEGGAFTTFPALDLSNGLNFNRAWADCSDLATFPPGLFDNCLASNFENAWLNCDLTSESVDNILTSLDASGVTGGTVNLDGGTSAAPGLAGLVAKASLESKGWTVVVNTIVYIYCTPEYPLLPVTYPPYSCNTVVNTAGVTDFSYAWDNCDSIVVFPCVDSSSVIDFSYTWNNCSYMTTFPAINTSNGLDFSGAWAFCYDLSNFPTINISSGTDFTYSWGYCYGLTSFPNVDVSSGIIFNNTWGGCRYLETFPALDVSSGEIFTWAWANCQSLTSFPALDVGSGLNFSAAWRNCYNLTSFPNLDVSSGTDFSATWRDCSGLTSFPLLNVSSGTDFSGAWDSCTGLTSFPLLNVSSGADFSAAWRSCSGLTSFPLLNVSSGTDFSGAWDSCTGLTSFPLLNVSSGADFYYTWTGCTGLTSFPSLDVSSGTNFSGAWSGCTGLTSFPSLDVSSGTDFSGAWANCSSLSSFPALNVGLGLYFGSSWYNCSSLTFFPALDVSSGTIFQSAWEGCTNLTSFPLLNVSSGTNFSGTWYGCTSLTSFPLLNVGQGTFFFETWRGCTSLTSFPALDFSLGGNFFGAWRGCSSLTSFPSVNFISGTDFRYAWAYCSALTSFPGGMFDSCTTNQFSMAWHGCALTQQSVDNILISLDASGQTNGSVSLDSGTSATPGPLGVAAKASLSAKGWSIWNN